MTKRRFKVRVHLEAVMEVDQQVFDVVDDEWREYLYPLYTVEDIASHVCGVILARNWPLSHLNGWADLPDEYVQYIEYPDWELDEIKELT